jgi:SAM-dependent methyltransferase
MNEHYYEKLLNIRTLGDQKVFNESVHYHRYEPTSYPALEILSQQYEFTPEDSVVDFGCGKGRFNFYVNHFFSSSVTGIEMNSYFYKQAVENKKFYFQTNKYKKGNIDFLNCFAETYDIKSTDNKFYFFNPFSMQIFAKVIKNILVSAQTNERSVDIILYYPSMDYIYFLDTTSPFTQIKEIKVPHMCDTDPRHRFLIYKWIL